MYQDYVGEQAPGSNEVSVIVLDRSSTVEQKSLKQSFTPDDVHQVPRIQNQVITEANNLLDTCSFNKIFDNIYNFNHQVSFINKMVSMTPLLTISLHCHTSILIFFFHLDLSWEYTVSQKRKSRLMNSSRGGTYTKLKYGVCWFMNKWELGLRSPLFGFIVILIFFSRIFRILVINLFWNFQSLYPP